eukprot:Polyplicarium_translucidae@DN2317_c0_g1_i1.p1
MRITGAFILLLLRVQCRVPRASCSGSGGPVDCGGLQNPCDLSPGPNADCFLLEGPGGQVHVRAAFEKPPLELQVPPAVYSMLSEQPPQRIRRPGETSCPASGSAVDVSCRTVDCPTRAVTPLEGTTTAAEVMSGGPMAAIVVLGAMGTATIGIAGYLLVRAFRRVPTEPDSGEVITDSGIIAVTEDAEDAEDEGDGAPRGPPLDRHAPQASAARHVFVSVNNNMYG